MSERATVSSCQRSCRERGPSEGIDSTWAWTDKGQQANSARSRLQQNRVEISLPQRLKRDHAVAIEGRPAAGEAPTESNDPLPSIFSQSYCGLLSGACVALHRSPGRRSGCHPSRPPQRSAATFPSAVVSEQRSAGGLSPDAVANRPSFRERRKC